jgi:menaquinone-dependent protoporphyrinogen oxidase
MPASILLAYATRSGSTAEVAESIAATLRDGGHEVDLRPARDVRSLDGFEAVVLGAPIYFGQWHKDARRFLSRHRQALTQRPLAIFALGPVTDAEEEMQMAVQQLDENLANFPWLAPVEKRMFVGRLDMAALPFPLSLMNVLPAKWYEELPEGDGRDWDAIRAWAGDLPAKLHLGTE